MFCTYISQSRMLQIKPKHKCTQQKWVLNLSTRKFNLAHVYFLPLTVRMLIGKTCVGSWQWQHLYLMCANTKYFLDPCQLSNQTIAFYFIMTIFSSLSIRFYFLVGYLQKLNRMNASSLQFLKLSHLNILAVNCLEKNIASDRGFTSDILSGKTILAS